MERCARPHEPQFLEEPAGITLGAGSAGEGFGWIRPARGPAMDGRPFSRDRSRVENPQPEPDPARRAISKWRREPPSLWGRRSVAPRVMPAGSCPSSSALVAEIIELQRQFH